MIRLRSWLIVMIGLICVPPLSAKAQIPADADIVAIVVKIEGSVYWKKRSDTAPTQLNALKDVGKVILFKEWVKVDPGSTLHVVDLRNKKPAEEPLTTPAHQTAQWVTFPHLPSGDQAALWHVLTAYSELGGRKRSSGSVFYSPAQDSFVRADKLVIDWMTGSLGKTVNLVITEPVPSDPAAAKPIWHEENVDGLSGRLDSPEARSALQAYRASGRHHQLALTSLEGKKEQTVRFSLLDAADEQEMRRQLADMDTLPELLRHTGRAYILNAFKLYNEAADEYDTALADAPDSTPLLLAAISAQQQTGNRAREQALRKRLPAGTKVPGDE